MGKRKNRRQAESKTSNSSNETTRVAADAEQDAGDEWKDESDNDGGQRVSQLYKNEIGANFKQLYDNYNAADYGKDAAKSHAHRTAGNQLFAKQLYLQSLEAYSQAAIWAKFEDRKTAESDLAIAFANRSAALVKLNRFEEALEDIQLASNHGYPQDKMAKLNNRKAVCEESIKRSAIEAERAKSNDRTSEELAAEESILFGFHSNLATLFLCPLTHQRGVKALIPLQRGTVLSLEKPYAAILGPECYQSHCYNCLRKLPQSRPYPCRRCVQIFYCSSHCEETAWGGYHGHECGYLDMIHICENFHYPPKMALRIILTTPREELLRQHGHVDRTRINYSAINSLITHSNECPDYTLPAALTLAYLITKAQVNMADSNEVECVAGKIIKHIQQCQVNGIRIVDSGLEVGSGLYQSFSMINHTCNPNCEVLFDGSLLSVRTLRNLRKDEEISISYGADVKKHSLIERRTYLTNNYFFKCSCSSCEN
ncbi:SET and MYND domain-containing protein 4 [Halotydeus destructor]|nr:SET and MYND domain-containing protein 4 [Halotydeus destructor]